MLLGHMQHQGLLNPAVPSMCSGASRLQIFLFGLTAHKSNVDTCMNQPSKPRSKLDCRMSQLASQQQHPGQNFLQSSFGRHDLRRMLMYSETFFLRGGLKVNIWSSHCYCHGGSLLRRVSRQQHGTRERSENACTYNQKLLRLSAAHPSCSGAQISTTVAVVSCCGTTGCRRLSVGASMCMHAKTPHNCLHAAGPAAAANNDRTDC